MRKIVSLLILLVLSFTMASCLGENQIEGISCTGFENQYVVNDVIDTSKVVVTVKYSVDVSANYTVGADKLEFVLPDMSTPGTKVIKVIYKVDGAEYVTEKTITVVESVEDKTGYTIVSVSKPLSIQNYEANIKEKNDKTSEFFDRDNGYVVGNQNPFKFLPVISALDENNDPFFVTEYHSYSRLYLVEDETKTELTGEELTKYVTIDEYKSLYQFTSLAAGKEFELSVQPYENRESDANKVTFGFKVIDGYNVYSAQDLMLMNNDPDHAEAWALYRSQNDIILPEVNVSTLIIQNTIKITPSDFPSSFFHQEDKIGDPNNIDYHSDIVKGTLKDQYELFSRRLTQDEVFTIHGNYFTINADEMPLVSNHGMDGSNTQLFFFNAEDNVTNSKVYIHNLHLFGNTNKSSFEKDYGGLIALKVHGDHGKIDFEVNNNIIKSFVINNLIAYENAKAVFNDCKLYDSYSNLGCNWEQSHIVYNHCYISESGGPLVVGTYTYDSNFPDSYITIEYNNDCEYDSKLLGTESWFSASGAVDKVMAILGVNDLVFKRQGGVNGLVNSDGVLSIPVAVIYEEKHPDKPYVLLKVSINGTTVINTVDDPLTVGIIETFLQPQYGGGTAPLFFNSNGMAAYFDGSSLKLVGTNEVLEPGHDFYTTGDYIAMYHSGNIYILDYNPTTIA